MKITVFVLLLGLFPGSRSLAQGQPPTDQKGAKNLVAFGINIPAGVFSETHIGGLSAAYSWSHHRFGVLHTLPGKLIGFTANGGIDYYFGKKIQEAGYKFTYGNYIYLHAFGGIIYNPCKRGNITLASGPAAGIYKGNADAGFSIKLDGSYYLTGKISLSPGIMYMKHALVNTLWSAMIKAAYNF